MNKNLKIYLFLVLTMVTSVANAFDGARHGFVLGLGIGFHNTTVKGNYSGLSSSVTGVTGVPPDESASGVATSFRIGAGFTDQVLCYYFNDVNWYNEQGSGDLTVIGLSGVGLSYYLSPSPKSLYLSAGYGLGGRSEIGDSQAPTYSGTGYSIGMGYEISKWIGFQLDYQNLSLKDKDYNYMKKDVKAIRFTFQSNFY